MEEHSIEISVRGKWVTVPALNVSGKFIVVRGKWVKVAVIHDEEWLETELDNPRECITRLKEQESQALHADIFTFAQKVPSTLPRYHYPLDWDSVAVARTTSFKSWWEKLPQESRKNVRRSQKRGVVVTVKDFTDDLITAIVGVNNDSPIRQGRPNTHFGKTFDQVKKDQSSFIDRSDFICACLGDEVIGFMKIVYRGEIASILNLAGKASHYDKRPTNALVAKAVEVCEAKGVSYLTYGGFHYGNKRASLLLEFKVRNGFQEMLMPRYYIALSGLGALYMKMRLHRGLLGILPPGMIRVGLSVRETLYNLRKQ
jgi:hypothetical protein